MQIRKLECKLATIGHSQEDLMG